jgi:DNA polymerase-3 subunit delta
VILWALARELRLLAGLAQQFSQGVPLDKPSARPGPSGTSADRW